MLNSKVKIFEDIKSPIITHDGIDYKKYQGVYWTKKLDKPYLKPGELFDMEKINEDRKKLEEKAKWYNKDLNAEAENEKLKDENKMLQDEVLENLDEKSDKKKGKKDRK